MISFIYQFHQRKVLKSCRLNLLEGYKVVGEVADITLPLHKPLSLYDLKWNVDSVRVREHSLSNESMKHEDKAMQTCLSKRFDSYHVYIEIGNNAIVKVENDMLVPVKSGKTSAVVQIQTAYSDDLKTPLPNFMDRVAIKVED